MSPYNDHSAELLVSQSVIPSFFVQARTETQAIVMTTDERQARQKKQDKRMRLRGIRRGARRFLVSKYLEEIFPTGEYVSWQVISAKHSAPRLYKLDRKIRVQLRKLCYREDASYLPAPSPAPSPSTYRFSISRYEIRLFAVLCIRDAVLRQFAKKVDRGGYSSPEQSMGNVTYEWQLDVQWIWH